MELDALEAKATGLRGSAAFMGGGAPFGNAAMSFRDFSHGSSAPTRNRTGTSAGIPLPNHGATPYSIDTTTGRRVVVVKSVDRPDVFLIRNFAELLRR